MKRDQINASSMPDAEKDSLSGTLSFIPKQGCEENPGVFRRGRGLLQKESLSGALHSLGRHSSREKGKVQMKLQKSTDSGRSFQSSPYTVEADCPSGMCLKVHSYGAGCRYRLSERLCLKEI